MVASGIRMLSKEDTIKLKGVEIRFHLWQRKSSIAIVVPSHTKYFWFVISSNQNRGKGVCLNAVLLLAMVVVWLLIVSLLILTHSLTDI